MGSHKISKRPEIYNADRGGEIGWLIAKNNLFSHTCPYKQAFSIQHVRNSGGGDDDEPNGNPPSCGKERSPKFYKIVNDIAPYVSKPSKKIGLINRILSKYEVPSFNVPQYSDVPEGWSRYQSCSLSYLHPGLHFGSIWQPDGMIANTLSIGQSAGTSGLGTIASKMNSSEQSFIDDEDGDKLIEKMLLDEGDYNGEEQEQVTKGKVKKDG
ncbi:unnamed protein product [Allacma fusca]|uniref:Uncharacterized protein n=1 Tax=Allacma fusca TaxID=39272 RepID=A0A8J2KUF5_9HEXA|nr:unnamed protein product [Allacma fusca]